MAIAYNKSLEYVMIDHLSLAVIDYEKSVSFFDETLKILGIERVASFETDTFSCTDYGVGGVARFTITVGSNLDPKEFIGKTKGFHMAFTAPNAAAVDSWYYKSLALGAKDNGPPGIRPEYHPSYYAAFIIDPNGYRLEAVFQSSNI
jgi:catechol 2,3-dioxygenase-like lactoylglutathione lyase family enzyme